MPYPAIRPVSSAALDLALAGGKLTLSPANSKPCDLAWGEVTIVSGNPTVRYKTPDGGVVAEFQAYPGYTFKIADDQVLTIEIEGEGIVQFDAWRYVLSEDDGFATGPANTKCASAAGKTGPAAQAALAAALPRKLAVNARR